MTVWVGRWMAGWVAGCRMIGSLGDDDGDGDGQCFSVGNDTIATSL